MTRTFLFTTTSAPVPLFAPDSFATSYAGRVGCMCGCRGQYSSAPCVIARRYRDALALIRSGDRVEAQATDKYLYVAYRTDAGVDRCVCLYRDV